MSSSRTFYALAGIVVVLDQLTKALAVYFLSPSGGGGFAFFLRYFTNLWEFPYEFPSPASAPKLLGDYVKLTLTTNNGIAWGLFRGYPIQLGILSLVLSAVIWWIFHRFARHRLYLAVSLGLIFGGAIGNLVDRFRVKEVVDFIDVLIPVVNYDFPIFNLADSSASIGTILIALYFITQDIKALKRRKLLEKYDHTVYR